MPDYEKGKIYGIYCEDELVYIGSTVQTLSNRISGHRRAANRNIYHTKIHNYMNEKGFSNFTIELFQLFPCNSKAELERQEGIIQREHKPLCNLKIAGRTHQEYYKDNIEKKKIKDKIYYEKNKDKILLEKKEYYEKNKDKKKLYDNGYSKTQKYKEKQKEYREQNKEILKEKSKEYREKNKEIIKLKKTENITCECGSKFNKQNLSRHLKTKKHIEYEKNKNDSNA